MSPLLHCAARPLAVDDLYVQPLSGPTIVPAPGVLSNDTIPCGANAVIRVTTSRSAGTVSLNADGSFIYTPNGPPTADSFKYEIDCNGLVSEATVLLPARPGNCTHCLATHWPNIHASLRLQMTIVPAVVFATLLDFAKSKNCSHSRFIRNPTIRHATLVLKTVCFPPDACIFSCR